VLVQRHSGARVPPADGDHELGAAQRRLDVHALLLLPLSDGDSEQLVVSFDAACHRASMLREPTLAKQAVGRALLASRVVVVEGAAHGRRLPYDFGAAVSAAVPVLSRPSVAADPAAVPVLSRSTLSRPSAAAPPTAGPLLAKWIRR
jgi:hypothetical protein